MSLFKAVSEKSSDKKIKKIFEDIKRKRKISKIPNFWRALANDPKTLERTWRSLQQVMGKGSLDPLIKENCECGDSCCSTKEQINEKKEF